MRYILLKLILNLAVQFGSNMGGGIQILRQGYTMGPFSARNPYT